MFERCRAFAKRESPRLVADLLVVIVGISVSLLLNDWWQGRVDRREEARLLESLGDELERDLAHLEARIDMLEKGLDLVRIAADPARRAELETEQRDQAMDALLGYLTFAPTRVTWLELSQAGRAELIRDKELLHAVIGHYERLHDLVREWDQINRELVLERVFPFVDEHGPAFAATADSAFAEGYHRAFDALQEDRRFRNLMRTSSMFKTGQRDVYRIAAQNTRALLEKLGRDVPPPVKD